MTRTVEAIYENGVLRPVRPLEGIDEQARVKVTVEKVTVEAEPPLVPVSQADAAPIWQLAEDLTRDLPEEVRARLPKDGAEEHDHYLYGTPRRR